MNSAVLALLFSFFLLTTSRFLQESETAVTPSDLTYAATLACGSCINRGFVSCTHDSWGTGMEHQSTNPPDTSWGTCRNTGDTALDASADWLCTSAYTSRAYAKYLCYYDTTQCGSTQWDFSLDEGGSQTITITGLAAGRTCFYSVKSNGGAPAFNVTTSDASTAYDVEWIEFSEDALQDKAYVAVGAGTSSSDWVKGSPPATGKGLPPRNARFSDGVGSSKIYMQDQYTTTNQTVGQAGRWSKTKMQKKVWGVDEQNDTAQFEVEDKDDIDQDRYQLISVTAISGTAITTLTLTLTSDEIMWNFASRYLMGAASIIVTFLAATLF